MSKKYKGKVCVYCALDGASSGADHVLAREFFLPERRANLPKVPACGECNDRKSELEHYLTAVLPFGGNHPDSTALLSAGVPKRLAKNPKLHQTMVAGFQAVELMEGGASLQEGVPLDFLERYVRAKLQSPVPADNARALMVLGYGLESAFADKELNRPIVPESLVGKAREAALYAYERNRWARHWYEKMAVADSAEEFWRYSILLTKIVDARFHLWEGDVSRPGAAIQSFDWSIEDEVKRRASNWKSHREKTLCGDKVPSKVFSVIDA